MRISDWSSDVCSSDLPPYVRPTQAGLIAHFRAVADDGELPVVLYNVPGRTGCDMLPETVAELAAHERIVGIKEARNDAERMQALLPLRGDGFAVLSGDDPTAVRAMLAGADGIVSVAKSEEHTSELQSLMRISYAVFCLTKKNYTTTAQLSEKHTTKNA